MKLGNIDLERATIEHITLSKAWKIRNELRIFKWETNGNPLRFKIKKPCFINPFKTKTEVDMYANEIRIRITYVPILDGCESTEIIYHGSILEAKYSFPNLFSREGTAM